MIQSWNATTARTAPIPTSTAGRAYDALTRAIVGGSRLEHSVRSPDARARHRRRGLPRLPPRRAPRERGPRRRRCAQRRLRPDEHGGDGPDVRGGRSRARLPPRGGSRRHRRQPRESRPLLVRQSHDGRARARASARPRDAEARHRRDRLRVSEVRADPVLRGRPLGRVSGGDERAVRRREEGDPRRRAGVSRAIRGERRLPAPDEPLRPARQLRPGDLTRHRGADPQDARLGGRGRPLGRRLADARVPLRRGLRRRARSRRRPLRRPSSR